MIIRKAFKFQLNTHPAQDNVLRQFAGCCRLVWNKSLALQKSRLDQKQFCLNYNELANELVLWKKDPAFAFLKTAHSQLLQQTLMNLDKALKEAFDKKNPKRFPQFKKKGRHDSFRYPQGFKLDESNSRIYLPKIGWVRYRNSRAIIGIPKNITISLQHGKWYASIQTEHEIENTFHDSKSMVGLDVGIANFVTLSDGSLISPVNSYRKHESKLKREQKLLSRKIKFSENWKKQKRKISTIHQMIARTRNDFLHKTSTKISKNHAIIVVEDLKIANMSRSASGTLEHPGRQIRAKSGLNKSILDQGWSEFRRQLSYKQLWQGGEVIAIPPQNTSRCCSICRYTSKENRKTRDVFLCVSCKHTEPADLNAAKNILAAGHAVLACGEKVRLGLSMKQEPAEIYQAKA